MSPPAARSTHWARMPATVCANGFPASTTSAARTQRGRRWLWLDDFAIMRHPVTNEAYLAFLRADGSVRRWAGSE